MWNVYVNHVRVGQISDQQERAIRDKNVRDVELYAQQAINAFWVLAKITVLMLTVTPLVAFWLVLAVWADAGSLTILGEALADQPFLRHTAKLYLILFFLFITLSATFGARFGFVNYFARERAAALRRHCNSAADGEVSIGRELVWNKR